VTVNDPRIGANIACCECGARPFPELGPPGTRQSFDLRKALDGWHCEQHPAAPRVKKSRSDVAKDFSFEQVETLLGELAGKVANLEADIDEDVFGEKVAEVDEQERGEALELIDSIQTAVGTLKRRT
jgi:hypothetical protein